MITDVPGIRVGHASDPVGLTGVSVVLCDTPAVAGVEMRGWANDVVGLDYLDPRHLVGTVNGVEEGSAGTNNIMDIDLVNGDAGIDYNFEFFEELS